MRIKLIKRLEAERAWRAELLKLRAVATAACRLMSFCDKADFRLTVREMQLSPEYKALKALEWKP